MFLSFHGPSAPIVIGTVLPCLHASPLLIFPLNTAVPPETVFSENKFDDYLALRLDPKKHQQLVRLHSEHFPSRRLYPLFQTRNQTRNQKWRYMEIQPHVTFTGRDTCGSERVGGREESNGGVAAASVSVVCEICRVFESGHGAVED